MDQPSTEPLLNLSWWMMRAREDGMSLPEFLDTNIAIATSQLTDNVEADRGLRLDIETLEAVRRALSQEHQDAPLSILDFVSVPASSHSPPEHSPREHSPGLVRSRNFESLSSLVAASPNQQSISQFQSKLSNVLEFGGAMNQDNPDLSYDAMQLILNEIIRSESFTLGIKVEHVTTYFHSLTKELPQLLNQDPHSVEQVRQLSSRIFSLVVVDAKKHFRLLLEFAALIKGTNTTLLDKLDVVCDLYQQTLESLVE